MNTPSLTIENGGLSTLRVQVLLVEAEEATRLDHARLLEADGYQVHACSTLIEARQHLTRHVVDLILCGMELDEGTGLELLAFAHCSMVGTPFILFSSVASVELAREALQMGACDFFVVPVKPEELPIILERNLTRKALQQREAIRQRVAVQRSQEGVLDALLSALSTRDTETQGHSERVTAYTLELADAIHLSPDLLYTVERGALLHDIGKIGIPDRILLKPDKLTEDEWEEMRKHPVIGYEMCVRVKQLEAASKIVLYHHESWNGKGYPHGLVGEEIPIGARIFAISDTFDAMTSNRPYRAGVSTSVARSEILRCRGVQFDPDLVDVFLTIADERWEQIRRFASE